MAGARARANRNRPCRGNIPEFPRLIGPSHSFIIAKIKKKLLGDSIRRCTLSKHMKLSRYCCRWNETFLSWLETVRFLFYSRSSAVLIANQMQGKPFQQPLGQQCLLQLSIMPCQGRECLQGWVEVRQKQNRAALWGVLAMCPASAGKTRCLILLDLSKNPM